MNLTEDLATLKQEIKGYAESYGLDLFETVFEIVEFDELNEVASYGGFPTRYPHWRFGMEYEELSKGYAYGLQKIYELVINNDPCYAYLMKCNNLVDQKLVMAHVYGHCDFFKNNLWFAHTNRKMMDQMANHSTQIRRHMEKYGAEVVEDFIEVCLSLENLIDPHAPYIKRKADDSNGANSGNGSQKGPIKFKSKSYMDTFINPQEFLDEQKQAKEERIKQRKSKYPDQPERDVLLFLLNNAPLDEWQVDILSIIRDEAYYFAPQGQTKIMNEGWATYWHSKIMTEKCLTDAELIDYADHHSGTLLTGNGRLNPYKLGVELFRDIEDRWNKGKFGKEYEECDDWEERKNWDKNLGLGLQIGYNDRNDTYEITDRDFYKVKQKLLSSLTNFGQPVISVTDANYLNRGELYLTHQHEGVDLKMDEAQDTLVNIQKVWSRPVHIETVVDEVKTLLSFDGQEHSEKELE